MIAKPGPVKNIIVFFLSVFFSYTSALSAEGNPDDILFFFVEKINEYHQSNEGELHLTDISFAAALFGTGNGKIESAKVTVPGKKGEFALKDIGRMHVFAKGPYDSIAALNKDFPDGEYLFSIKSEHNDIVNQAIALRGKGQPEDYPPAPKVDLLQEGKVTHPENIDPNKDLTLRWTPFSSGQADPRGILDDVVMLLTNDCNGDRVGTSGLPFKDSSLTFRDNSHTISAGSLNPGVPYNFRLEHIRNTDTVRNGNVPALGVYATITVVTIKTKGEAINDVCTE